MSSQLISFECKAVCGECGVSFSCSIECSFLAVPNYVSNRTEIDKNKCSYSRTPLLPLCTYCNRPPCEKCLLGEKGLFYRKIILRHKHTHIHHYSASPAVELKLCWSVVVLSLLVLRLTQGPGAQKAPGNRSLCGRCHTGV